MAIFRCQLCDKVFDLSMQYVMDVGMNYCGKCHSFLKEQEKKRHQEQGKDLDEVMPKDKKFQRATNERY